MNLMYILIIYSISPLNLILSLGLLLLVRLHLYEVEVGVQVPLDSPQVALQHSAWDHALELSTKYPEKAPNIT